jgi:hypothetical protein
VTTAELRKAVKAVDPRARVSKIDDGHWTIRTEDSDAAIKRLLPTLGLTHDPQLTETEGSRWDWITVLHVFEAPQLHAATMKRIDTEMSQLTADTITDDQIRALRAGYLAERDINGVDACDVALGRHGAKRNPKRVARARARCAEILNRREKKSPAQLDAEIAEALAKEGH